VLQVRRKLRRRLRRQRRLRRRGGGCLRRQRDRWVVDPPHLLREIVQTRRGLQVRRECARLRLAQLRQVLLHRREHRVGAVGHDEVQPAARRHRWEELRVGYQPHGRPAWATNPTAGPTYRAFGKPASRPTGLCMHASTYRLDMPVV
jgi:hypothetical protein